MTPTAAKNSLDSRLTDIVKHYRAHVLETTPSFDDGFFFDRPNPSLLRTLAEWYDDAPRRTQVDYGPFKSQVASQFRMARAFGYSIELMDENPFDTSRELTESVRDEFHLPILSSDTGEFPGNHPLMIETHFTDVNGQSLVFNDVFRFVHDLFGHVHIGYEVAPFTPEGEYRAWRMHRQMFDGDAQGVLGTETMAQIAWMTSAPRFDGDDRPVGEREFPEQKIVAAPGHTLDALANYPI